MHYSRALFATYFQWGCWIKEDLCKVINMDSELPGWPEVLLSEKKHVDFWFVLSSHGQVILDRHIEAFYEYYLSCLKVRA